MLWIKSVVLLGGLGCLFIVIYVLQTPDLGRLSDLSSVVRSKNDEVLELRLSKSGHWRETVQLKEIDPQLIELLIAYEDKRYWQHYGVDPLAVLRAIKDYVATGRVISGASTLTM